MRILVTGAGGFLGHRVVNRLIEAGHTVRAIVRPGGNRPEWGAAVELYRADLRVHKNLDSAFEGIDAVFHLAAATSGNEDLQFASTVVATERFLQAMARSGVRRLIHVSSFVVYDWSAAKNVMDENTPLLNSGIYDMGGYTIAKIWQERIVSRFAKAQSWNLTIMRPGFIRAGAHRNRRHGPPHRSILSDVWSDDAASTDSHVDNCADCLVAALGNPAAIGESFNLIDGDNIRVWRYVHEYARHSGRHGMTVPLPYMLGLGIARLASMTSCWLFGEKGRLPSLLVPRRFESQFKPLRFSSHKLRKVLNWVPPQSFEKCLGLSFHETPKLVGRHSITDYVGQK